MPVISALVESGTSDQRVRPLWLRIAVELVLLAGGFGLYNLGRLLAASHVEAAYAHADSVWSLERLLRLPDEQLVQNWALHTVPQLVHASDAYYDAVHFPLTIAVLVWLFCFRPSTYPWVRTSLILATGLGLVLHFVYPLAPPRLVPHLGMVDTERVMGSSLYGPDSTNGVIDQYAAMPSVHVAWALLVAMALIAATRSRWRWLWLAHPVLTMAVVVVTANHYWVDGLAGAALVLASMAMCAHAADAGLTSPDPTAFHELSPGRPSRSRCTG